MDLEYSKATLGIVQEDGSLKDVMTMDGPIMGISDTADIRLGPDIPKEDNPKPLKTTFTKSFKTDGTLFLIVEEIANASASLIGEALNYNPLLLTFPFTITNEDGPVLDATEDIPYDHNKTTVTLKFDINTEETEANA